MQLEKGSLLGQFEILGPLGAGGMGEVYLAQDTKLERQVAIKVLPASFAADPERLHRLGREARTLASLNHANVAGLYDFQESEGMHYLVMELVDGESLEDRLLRGPLSLDDALPIFAQVARGLEAAHERGIVHRDLKPGNIMVGKEGDVKVLDFGLAKAFDAQADQTGDDSSVQAGTQNLTAEGIIVGTPTYMSPEQARAKDVDKRTDIWALGCTLYESLTGKPPFKGSTPADLIAHILRDTPDLDALPPQTPESVRNLIRRCLERDRRNRLKDAGDIAITLKDARTAFESPPRMKAPEPTQELEAASSTARGSQRIAIVSATVALICAGLLVWALRTRPSDAPPFAAIAIEVDTGPKPVRRFSITLPDNFPLKRPNPVIGDQVIAISPDGSTLVYVAEKARGSFLVRRRLDEIEVEKIEGSKGAWSPFFSPDGKWVGYFTRGAEAKLKKIPLEGGVTVPLCDVGLPFGGSWRDDDVIYFGRGVGYGVWSVPAEGGTPEPVTEYDEETDAGHGYPQALTSARNAVLYGNSPKPGHANHATVIHRIFDSGERFALAEDVGMFRYLPTGHLVVAGQGTFSAMIYDPDEPGATGSLTPVTESRMVDGTMVPRNFTISDDGTLVYVPAGLVSMAARELVWVDRHGMEAPIGAPLRPYSSVRVSPNGTHLALDLIDLEDVWIHDLQRGTTQRLTFDFAQDYRPIWTPDNKCVFFLSSRGDQTSIYCKQIDGGGELLHIVDNPLYPYPESISPDGKTLIFAPVGAAEPVWSFGIGGSEEPRKLFDGKFNERNVRLSPDGKWISYESNETGQAEIYVRSFPELGSRWQVSSAGGEEAVWNPTGADLLYWEGTRLMSVPIETEPTFMPGEPTALFEMPNKVAYDVAPDGQKFAIIRETEVSFWATELIVVENWFEELKRLVPVASAEEAPAQSQSTDD